MLICSWGEKVIHKHICDVRGCCFTRRDCALHFRVAARINIDVLITLYSFRKTSKDTLRNKFKQSFCQEEMHVTAVVILQVAPSTACAFAYNMFSVGSNAGPVEGSSEGIVRSTLGGVFWELEIF